MKARFERAVSPEPRARCTQGLASALLHLALRTASELELELIQPQMTQKPMLRAEVGMRVRCANKVNKASAE